MFLAFVGYTYQQFYIPTNIYACICLIFIRIIPITLNTNYRNYVPINKENVGYPQFDSTNTNDSTGLRQVIFFFYQFDKTLTKIIHIQLFHEFSLFPLSTKCLKIHLYRLKHGHDFGQNYFFSVSNVCNASVSHFKYYKNLSGSRCVINKIQDLQSMTWSCKQSLANVMFLFTFQY